MALNSVVRRESDSHMLTYERPRAKENAIERSITQESGPVRKLDQESFVNDVALMTERMYVLSVKPVSQRCSSAPKAGHAYTLHEPFHHYMRRL